MGEYSISITPDSATIAEVKALKDLLRSEVGWYASCNSDAHISLATFSANERQMSVDENRVRDFCSEQLAREIVFNRLQLWKYGTLCLLPDASSQIFLVQLMRAFKAHFKKGEASITPHITIARGLDEAQLQKIANTWETKQVYIPMLCDNISIRVLDKTLGQFTLQHKILFGSKDYPKLNYTLF